MTYDYFSDLKIIKHPDKIKELFESGDSFPIMAEIDPTNACNFNCYYCCDREINKDRKSLPKTRAFTLIDELCAKNLKSVVIKGGGEPLISPYVEEYLKHIHSKGLDIGIITNGSNIPETLCRTICATSKWIKISLDAGTEKTHTEMHRPLNGPVFDKVLSNIEKLVGMRGKNGSGLTIGVNFTINEINYPEIVLATDLVKKIGVDYILLKIMVFEERGVSGDLFRKRRNQTEKLIKEAQKLATGDFHVFFRDLKNADKGWKKCLFNPFITIICANGDVYPCCHTKGRKGYLYGNILDNSFLDVWKGALRKEVYRKCVNKECLKYCSFRYTGHNRILNYIFEEQPHENFI
ncbi:MAG: radical SAM protein [Patescibacteria group bacterium]|nr:radical SAM protein [Patescibacteria group bacterium]